MHSERLYDSYDIEAVIRLFEAIASDEGWSSEGGLRNWINRSVYFGVRSAIADGTIIGGLQLVLPEQAVDTMPSDTVWPELAGNVCRDTTAHIAVMAIDKEWRGKFVTMFWRLEVLLWRYCVFAGIRELTLEATPRTLRCYQRFGWPMVIQGELREHWGEPCYPCSVTVREVGGAIAEKGGSVCKVLGRL